MSRRNTVAQKVVVVTGASAGVGRAVVEKFARAGAKVALLARGEEGLEGALQRIEEMGGEALPIQVDVSDPQQVENAAARVVEYFGGIDIWINNAMVSQLAPFSNMENEDFRRITEVTYLGYVYGTKAALKRMIPRNRGVIIQVGSALAYRGIPLQSAYCGAKHAIRGFTDALRTELLHDKSNIHLTAVHLPALNTPQFSWVKNQMPRKAQPVPPIFQPEVAAEGVYFAATHKRREVYVGWSTVKAIAGNKVAPGYADRFLAKRGYESQQWNGPTDPHAPNNLWTPVREDRGAHGPFDSRAKSVSLHLWYTMNRRWIGGALAVCILAAALWKAAPRDLQRAPDRRISAETAGKKRRIPVS